MKNQKKDAYWFPHYSNTRNEPLIAAMRMKLGVEGYGVYIMILEMMRDADEYKLNSTYEVIAYTLHLPNHDLVRKVIEDFGLFEFENDTIIICKRLAKLMSGYDQTIINSQISGYRSALVRYRGYEKNELRKYSNAEIIKIYTEEFSEDALEEPNFDKDFIKSLKDSSNKESIIDDSISQKRKKIKIK
ncbi:Lin1244/Lin1753 domain-containing protein [Nonlabens ponticola]|nr:Lin1244/Lin1753 domain-containing protein [Nonlabens ponticola]